MGYVGVVTAACLAEDGHDVIGVDVAEHKVRLLNSGESPVVERGLSALVAAGVAGGRFHATLDAEAAVLGSQISLISVGTPSRPNGSVDMQAVEGVSDQIGRALAHKAPGHALVVRSTLPPGATRKLVIPRVEGAAGLRCGQDFSVAYNPEFLREGVSVEDFRSPPFTVLGEADPGAADLVASLYAAVPAPMHRSSLEVAEALKYAANAFHALKITFANELGVAFRALGVDSRAVMDLVCSDTKLNLSAAYLRPGFAFGGSCLPKDLRALLFAAREQDVALPLLSHVLPSNQEHIERAVRMVLATGERDLALLGLSFKPGTDDLRESPLVLLAERLIGKGCRLRIYDPDVRLAQITGANRAFIERELPHIGELLSGDLDAVLKGAKVAVVGRCRGQDLLVLGRWAETGVILDLDSLPPELRRRAREYHGICW
jgi:GDP-mannose 6-dehydrogenase